MEKITVKLTGEDGNIFSLMGKVSRKMKRAGQGEEATEMTNKIFNAGSYSEALCIIQEYVNVR